MMMWCDKRQVPLTLAALIVAGQCALGLAQEAKPRPKPREHAGLATAAEAAQRDGEPIMIVFGATWCQPCQALKQETLNTDAFLGQVGMLHIVHIDIDAQADVARRFQVGAIPEIVLMTGESMIVSRRRGFAESDELLKWVEEGRGLASRGAWAGLPGEGEAPTTDDPAALVAALGDASHDNRRGAATRLAAMRARAVPHLINGLGDKYLGVRIGASDVLKRLAPDAPQYDAWSAATQRGEQIKAIKTWWKEAGTLPVAGEQAAPLNPSERRTIDDAVADARSDDPVRRTRAMTTLVRLGASALPAVPAAIRRSAESGDQKSVWVFENVRWAILVPQSLESKLKVRFDLARGASEQRQAAAVRLGSAGESALPVLRELINDGDGLVREAASRALTKVGGADAMAATAVLLEANDANLRMVAAQQLGESGDAAAARYLIKAIDDPDELVATVAIAALEQIKATSAGDALTAALDDPRWRVRAAAAETLGKLEVADATERLTALLDDEDAFVVKNALDALAQLGHTPEPDRLRQLIDRLPDLTQKAVAMILRSKSGSDMATIEQIYDTLPSDRRLDVLAALAEQSARRGGSDEAWKGVLDKTAAVDDPAYRAALVEVLKGRPVLTSGPYLLALLKAKEPAVRTGAAALVVRAAGRHYGIASNDGYSGILDVGGRTTQDDLGVLDPDFTPPKTDDDLSFSVESDKDASDDDEAKTAEKRAEHAEQARKWHAQWHEALADQVGPEADAWIGLAYYLTHPRAAPPEAGLTVVSQLIKNGSLAKLAGDYKSRSAIPILLARLPWPQSREVISAAMDTAALHAAMLQSMQHAAPDVRTLLTDRDRLLDTFASSDVESLEPMFELFLDIDTNGPLNLYTKDESGATMLTRMLKSPSPAARAVGIYLTGLQKDAAFDDDSQQFVRASLQDENEWVRHAAVQAAVNLIRVPAERESAMGPLLDDPSPHVAALAAYGLLDPAITDMVGFNSHLSYFRFQTIDTWASSSATQLDSSQLPPPIVIERKPAFLDTARKRLADPKTAQNEQLKTALSLLLAQYGEFEPLNAALDKWLAGPKDTSPPMLMIGLLLSHDERYLPPVKVAVDRAEERYSLSQTLQWLRGVPGSAARSLRRDINRRLRAMPQY